MWQSTPLPMRFVIFPPLLIQFDLGPLITSPCSEVKVETPVFAGKDGAELLGTELLGSLDGMMLGLLEGLLEVGVELLGLVVEGACVGKLKIFDTPHL